MDVSASNLGIIPENIPVLLFYLLSSFKPRPPHCSRPPFIASSRKRSIGRAGFVWTLDFLLEIISSGFFFNFLPQEDLKFLLEQLIVEKPKTLKELVRFPRQSCGSSAVPLPAMPEPSVGQLLSDTMLQRCFTRAEHQEPVRSHEVT